MEKEPYQVIPRKYRPQTFASVVGQEAIVTTLKNALRMGRLAQAYLFSGSRGTGKTTLARVFAKALNCSSRSDAQEPCNACPSCLAVVSGRSLDVLEIDGASNRGIDDIRQINETIGYQPATGQYKIYIIDEVHMLTKEAFNALLKTLEEPPANVKFFFATTEPHKIPPTILSRCQRYDLNRIAHDTIVSKLEWIAQDLDVPCEKQALSLIAQIAEGGLRDAESLMDQVICYAEKPITEEKVAATLGLMPQASFSALDRAIASQNFSFAFELSHTIFSSGKDLGHFLDNLLEHFRCILHVKLGHPSPQINPKDIEHYSNEQCLQILDYLIHWQQQMHKTPLKRITLEMILLHLIRTQNRVCLSNIAQRLIALEGKINSPAPVQQKTLPNPKPLPEEVHTSAPQPLEEKITLATPVQKKPLPDPKPLPEEVHTSSPESVDTLLLKKVKEKIEEPKVEPVTTTTQIPPQTLSRYETIARFAAVELEGVVKK